MEKSSENRTQPTYQFGNTLYQVTTVFRDAPKIERLEDKIIRLILKDHSDKPPAA